MITTTVQKWGNSLAVRIPKPLVMELRVDAGDAVELRTVNDGLLIVPARRRRLNLRSLLKGITTRNRHSEVLTGRPVGGEAW